ncbi:MAG: hypothetical protein Fues2KO_47770 [Fuerstiella sp.]
MPGAWCLDGRAGVRHSLTYQRMHLTNQGTLPKFSGGSKLICVQQINQGRARGAVQVASNVILTAAVRHSLTYERSRVATCSAQTADSAVEPMIPNSAHR